MKKTMQLQPCLVPSTSLTPCDGTILLFHLITASPKHLFGSPWVLRDEFGGDTSHCVHAIISQSSQDGHSEPG
jgi:hypothetical protein